MGNYINNIKDDREVEYSLYDRRLFVGGHATSLYLDSPDTSLNNYAGAKGWYLKSWVPVSGTTDTFNVELVNDTAGTTADSNLFEENDILSARATFSANYSLKVLSIVDPITCKLQVQYTDEFKYVIRNNSPWDPASYLYTNPNNKGYIWNPSKPSIGSVPIGVGALTIGSDNIANEWGSLAIGYDNKVDGRYAFAAGIGNKVAYSSAVIGGSNEVYGYYSLAVGEYNKTRGWNNAAIGISNVVESWDSFVSGINNQALKTSLSGISIRGRYAQIQNTQTYIDVVGGGSNGARSNAYALKPNGELRLHGDIYVRCDDDSSNGVNISGEYEVVKINGQNEYEFPSSHTGNKEFDIPDGKHCVIVWLYFLPTASANTFRVYANELSTSKPQYASQITTSTSNYTHAKIKFDCTHGILESEWAQAQTELGGFAPTPGKTTYASYSKDPTGVNSITKIILRQWVSSGTQPGTIPAGTKIKIYAY